MILRELVPLAISRLASARLRALLTMLGVIIGVGAIVALVSVAQGATSGITNLIEGLGVNLLQVSPGASTTGFLRGAAGSATTLTIDDATAIAGIDGVAEVAPQASTIAVVVAGGRNTTTSITGVTPEFASVRAYEIWRGAFLSPAELDRGVRVAVLGSATADDLGLGADGVGSEITVGGVPFRVVGILQPKGILDDQVLVPLPALRDYFVAGKSLTAISVSVLHPENIPLTKFAIRETLRQRHKLAVAAADDFTIVDQAQLLSAFGTITGILSLLLAGIASISLLVGGIGIMNIMLVSVRERTREIGIRKAVGARGRDILIQFLVEALVLSLTGGVIGVVLGVGASALIGTIAGWGLNVSPTTVALAVGFSLGVGAWSIPDTIGCVIPILFPRRSAAFVFGCLSFVLIGWGSLLVPSLAREVEGGFGQTDVGLGFFYFVTAVAYALGSVLGGMATERIGRRTILPLAVALLGLGLIAQGVTGDWGLFVLAGIVRSAGAGAIDGGGNGLVLDLFQDQRGGRLNLLHLFFALGALGAPFLLAARDVVGLSWQAVIVGSGLIALPLAAAMLVTDLADGRARPQRAHGGQRSNLVSLPLVVLAVAIGCYVASEIGVSNWLVRFLAAAPAATATSALGLFWTGLTAGRFVASRVADRFDHVRLAIAASLTAGVALMAAVLVPSMAASILLFVVVGFASGPIYPLIVAIGGERYPDRAAAVSGVIVAASVVGSVLYPPLMGVMSVTVGLPVAMFGTAVVCVACAAALAIVGRMPAAGDAQAVRGVAS